MNLKVNIINDSNRICPVWLAYTFILPIRKFLHNPGKLLSPYVKADMTVMDYGCAMGWFSIQMARMTGKNGKVYCVDIQHKMLEKLKKRASKFEVSDIIKTMQVGQDYDPDELKESLDFVLLFAVVHEVPDKDRLFSEIYGMLKPGGKVFISEPKGHVSQEDFEKSLEKAFKAGLMLSGEQHVKNCICRILSKGLSDL